MDDPKHMIPSALQAQGGPMPPGGPIPSGGPMSPGGPTPPGAPKMFELEVPGACLHYQVTGSGPILLTITGALGSKEIWMPLTQCLKDKFSVVSYDRRGYSRSILTGAQDYDHMLQRDADDAAALLEHLSPGKPAYVLGSSSGAVVSLELLRRHPELIKMLTAHEPPANRLNPGFQEVEDGLNEFYETYRTSGPVPAIEKFCEIIKIGAEKPVMMRAFNFRTSPYTFSNTVYWIEREVPRYAMTPFTCDMFAPVKDKLLCANSQLTPKDIFHFRANENLARTLGLELPLFAGGHVGFATHAGEFAKDYLQALAKRGVAPGQEE